MAKKWNGLKHLRAQRIEVSNNYWTVCGRVVAAPNSHTANIAKVNCKECLEKTHKNQAFEITHVGLV